MEINKENTNKKRLGRGLGSLLGGAVNESSPFAQAQEETTRIAPPQTTAKVSSQDTVETSPENRVWNIAIDKLVPGVYQPRKNFDKESLNELANSIKENGIIQPITVRKRQAGGFEILAGERRWRAAQAAGLHEVPAIIKTLSDREALQVALIENIQREDLDPIEEAESYQRLIEEFSLSQAEAAEKVGKERSSVANALRLLSLPLEIRDMLSAKQISVGHAKAILSLTDKARQINLAKKVSEGGMSVRSLEAEIKSFQKNPAKSVGASSATGLNVDLAGKLAAELADQLQKSLGTKVEISYKSGKGSVQVHFYSDDQLTQIYEKLKS
ncbi:ParB/RepB/Spo0J family partition protein [bacterium]|nr:ParB/RepB/Spo0J family partition protein [bacterium]